MNQEYIKAVNEFKGVFRGHSLCYVLSSKGLESSIVEMLEVDKETDYVPHDKVYNNEGELIFDKSVGNSKTVRGRYQPVICENNLFIKCETLLGYLAIQDVKTDKYIKFELLQNIKGYLEIRGIDDYTCNHPLAGVITDDFSILLVG